MSSRLVISAIAPNQPGMANKITRLISDLGATILESRMTVMGNEFAVIMEVGGEWNALAKLEHQLPAKAQSLNLITMFKRTDKAPAEERAAPYRVRIITLEDKGVTSEITEFFAEKKINIEEMNCHTYHAPHTGTLMGEIKMTVSISVDASLAKIKRDFEELCTKRNLDANIEPLQTA